MKRSRFTGEQIVGILRAQEAGASVAVLCRKHGMSSATFYSWKSKYGGMDVSDAKRLKALEAENAKLKRLYADAMLDNTVLKDLLEKNCDARREAGRGRSCRRDPRHERAAGVRQNGRRPKFGALPQRSPG